MKKQGSRTPRKDTIILQKHLNIKEIYEMPQEEVKVILRKLREMQEERDR